MPFKDICHNNFSNKQRALFIALDKSGSMSGGPIEAVKEGTKIVSQMNEEWKVFKELFLLPFDSYV